MFTKDMAPPLYRIGINAVETVPGLHIGVKVAQDKILVVVLQQGVVNTPKVTSAVFKEAVDELIGNGFKARILPAFLGSAVSAVDIILHGLVCGKAKNGDIVVTHEVPNLHIRAVQRAKRDGTVHHKFHIAGAAGLLTGGGDLLGDLAGGHQMLGKGYPVIFQKHHLQFAPAAGIVGDVVRPES